MRMNLRQCVWILALMLSIGIVGGAARASATPSPQDRSQNQDYSKNKKYQQGLREGRNDSKHKRDHSKKRNFKKDQDQRAYETGYQRGHDSYQQR